MDFHTYITTRDVCAKASVNAEHCDTFYDSALTGALAIQSAQFYFQLTNERDWERDRRPYYNVWPSIVPMLTFQARRMVKRPICWPSPRFCPICGIMMWAC